MVLSFRRMRGFKRMTFQLGTAAAMYECDQREPLLLLSLPGMNSLWLRRLQRYGTEMEKWEFVRRKDVRKTASTAWRVLSNIETFMASIYKLSFRRYRLLSFVSIFISGLATTFWFITASWMIMSSIPYLRLPHKFPWLVYSDICACFLTQLVSVSPFPFSRGGFFGKVLSWVDLISWII